MYVRISRGHFEPERAAEIATMLNATEEKLAPAIKKLAGLRSYQTGIDAAAGSMIAVSVWDSLEQSAAMGRLPEMSEARAVFQAHNINFDPISTYEILWQV